MTIYENPSIYVADLAAYNNGCLHGIWIDATQELDDIQAQIQAMLKNSPEPGAEEYAIHAYENFDGVALSEYEGLARIVAYAAFLGEYPDIGGALLAHFGNDVDAAEAAATEQYQGCYDSVADYAQDITEETSDIPPHLAFYIDYEKMARDMEMNGDIFTLPADHGKVYVFWHC